MTGAGNAQRATMVRFLTALGVATMFAAPCVAPGQAHTADPIARGLQLTQFPRIVKLAQQAPIAVKRVYDELDGKLK